MYKMNDLVQELKERLYLRKLQRRYEQLEDELISNEFEIYQLLKQLKGLKYEK